ncbi:MAG: invasion associated locus B family protein [Alphaproteobacteria bacterium]
MTVKGLKIFGTLGAALFMTALVTPVEAQQGTILGSYRDWDALVLNRDAGEKKCYMISMPKSKQPSSVTHGDVYIIVTHRPRRKITDEVNLVVAYNFKTGSEVRGTIGSSRYTLFTEGYKAWNYDQREDTKMVNGMKRGNTLVMNATSSRGTSTSYRFSLAGFTAAYNAITKECS